jgi:hypothetical protein
VETDNEADLEQYRELVVAELERRAIRVQQLESEISTLQFTLDAAARTRKASMANTARTQVEAAHKAKLRGMIRELEKKRAEAALDFEKAQARLREVDERIQELAAIQE